MNSLKALDKGKCILFMHELGLIFGLIICWKRCMLFHNLKENCKVISIQLWVNDSSSVWRFLHFPIIFVWQTWFVAVSSPRITSFTARSSPTCPAVNWWTCSTLTLGTKSESTTVNSESCWTSSSFYQLRSDQGEAVCFVIYTVKSRNICLGIEFHICPEKYLSTKLDPQNFL